jgi:hypothetical protein
MAQHVRRAMMPNNHTVFKKSFAEGSCIMCFPCIDALVTVIPFGQQRWMEIKSLISTGQIQSKL